MAEVRRMTDPDEAKYLQSHDLGPTIDFEFENEGRGAGITGTGHANEVMSHATQAMRELLEENRPAGVVFTAKEPSRRKLYEHVLRRFNQHAEDFGDGRYRAVHAWNPRRPLRHRA